MSEQTISSYSVHSGVTHFLGSEDIYVTLSFYSVVFLCFTWVLIVVVWSLCRNTISTVLLKDVAGTSEGHCDNRTNDENFDPGDDSPVKSYSNQKKEQ